MSDSSYPAPLTFFTTQETHRQTKILFQVIVTPSLPRRPCAALSVSLLLTPYQLVCVPGRAPAISTQEYGTKYGLIYYGIIYGRIYGMYK